MKGREIQTSNLSKTCVATELGQGAILHSLTLTLILKKAILVHFSNRNNVLVTLTFDSQ